MQIIQNPTSYLKSEKISFAKQKPSKDRADGSKWLHAENHVSLLFSGLQAVDGKLLNCVKGLAVRRNSVNFA
jgi:hypothetical protein